MSRQSEQILEEQLITQLQKLGYSYFVINSERDLLVNLKGQLEKHDNTALTKTGNAQFTHTEIWMKGLLQKMFV
jgi:type I restriction enzyme, R subunit